LPYFVVLPQKTGSDWDPCTELCNAGATLTRRD
jgi:hypothetical protein